MRRAKYISVNPSKVVLNGLLGAVDVLGLAGRLPGKFTSVTSMVGTDSLQVAPILALTRKLRFFHDDQDFLVHAGITRARLKCTKSFSGNVANIEFPGASHNSWNPAFAREDYWEWVFGESQR